MAAAATLGDVLALKIQELRRHQDEPRPLLRIDNRTEAAAAPFQFDTVAACVHRNGCRAIPSGSRTALYGLWQIPPQVRQYACPVCRPEADEASEMAREGPSDYIFGLLSVLDQFGGVIRERGRDFRESDEGRQLTSGLDGVYRNLEERERATLQVVLNSLDGLLATLSDIHQSLDAEPANGASENGAVNGNGASVPHDAASINGDRTRNGNGDRGHP
jgi:hypothetical protein